MDRILPDVFQMLYLMGIAYNPRKEPNAPKSFRCLITCVGKLLPDQFVKSFYLDYLSERKLTDADLKSSDALLDYLIHFHRYLFVKVFKSSIEFKNANDVKKYYKDADITTWSHPTWRLIHGFTRYYPRDTYDHDFAVAYKCFIVCLQDLLPCGKCRNHLAINLSDHQIDSYFTGRKKLFLWGYLLHEKVNKATDNASLSISDAEQIHGIY